MVVVLAWYACLKLVHLSRQFSTKLEGKIHVSANTYFKFRNFLLDKKISYFCDHWLTNVKKIVHLSPKPTFISKFFTLWHGRCQQSAKWGSIWPMCGRLLKVKGWKSLNHKTNSSIQGKKKKKNWHWDCFETISKTWFSLKQKVHSLL